MNYLLAGITLIVLSPAFLYLAYCERGYWAYGGEIMAMLALIITGITFIRKHIMEERFMCARENPHDLRWKKFGDLLVISNGEYRSRHGDRLELCRCDCGRFLLVPQQRLLRGKAVQCSVCAGCGYTSHFVFPNEAEYSSDIRKYLVFRRYAKIEVMDVESED